MVRVKPCAGIVAEMETCIAHYRNNASAGLDPYQLILKWFNRAQTSAITWQREDPMAFLKEMEST